MTRTASMTPLTSRHYGNLHASLYTRMQTHTWEDEERDAVGRRRAAQSLLTSPLMVKPKSSTFSWCLVNIRLFILPVFPWRNTNIIQLAQRSLRLLLFSALLDFYWQFGDILALGCCDAKKPESELTSAWVVALYKEMQRGWNWNCVLVHSAVAEWEERWRLGAVLLPDGTQPQCLFLFQACCRKAVVFGCSLLFVIICLKKRCFYFG